MDVFTYRLAIRNPKNLATEKKIKKSRSSSLSYFLSCFFGEKTNLRGMAESQKGSQTGAGQERGFCL
jgi:hypothetical protein